MRISLSHIVKANTGICGENNIDGQSLPQWGRLRNENAAIPPYCHFERKREIFFVRGQAKDVRIAASGKHRASSESEGRCFMQTALRKKTETGNEKDPSATLGMTKRGNASFHSFSTCCGSQPRLAALGSPFQGKGLAWTLPPSYGRRCPEGAEVGWGWRYERERGNASQVDDKREHPIHRCAVPLPQWERQRGGGFAAQKRSQPRLAAPLAPSKGRGSRGRSLLPMEGGAPKGRRLDVKW